MIRLLLRLLTILPLPLLGLACSRDGLQSVEGKLFVKGQPAKGAMVIFHKEGDNSISSPKPAGQVDANGTFKLQTADKEGAPAGNYVVVVYWEQKPDAGKQLTGLAGGDSERAQTFNRMAGTPYATKETTTLKAAIKNGSTVLEPFRID